LHSALLHASIWSVAMQFFPPKSHSKPMWLLIQI